MDEKNVIRKEVKVVCPQCGKALPVRILELKGSFVTALYVETAKPRARSRFKKTYRASVETHQRPIASKRPNESVQRWVLPRLRAGF